MKRDEDEKATGLEALGRAVLQVIDKLQIYPSDPNAHGFRCGDFV